MKMRTSATLAVISFGLLCLSQSAQAETAQVVTATTLNNILGGNAQAVLNDTKSQCIFIGHLLRTEKDDGFKVDVERKSCANDVGILVEQVNGTVYLGEFPIVPPCEDDKDCYRALAAGSVATLEYSK